MRDEKGAALRENLFCLTQRRNERNGLKRVGLFTAAFHIIKLEVLRQRRDKRGLLRMTFFL